MTKGHNNPPDPIDEALAPYADAISEAENWLDGEPVTDKAQMHAVDAILKQIRSAGTDLAKAEKGETAPLHDAWKAEKARWKPTIDDIDRMKRGLASLVNDFKRKLAAEQEAKKRAAYEEAQRLEREAIEAAAKADAGNIEDQRAVAQAKAAAMDAKNAASDASRNKVNGLRKVQRYEITDHRAALHWIAKMDRDAMTAFIEDYVRKNYKRTAIDGVTVTKTKEAY